MILKFLILTTLLSAGIQAIPNVEQKPNRPSTFQEQVAAWATNAPFNAVYGVVAGSPVGQQQVGVAAQHNREPQIAFNTQLSAVVGNAGVPPASEPAAVHTVEENDVKIDDYDAYHDYLSYYEDQVTAFPLHDDEDSVEEQEVWPPVGILPPPPPPPVRPTYYPPYYPTTKPPTRPTTVRPRPPQYPSLYPQYPTPPPKPPHYPQYPISQLPPLPHYPRPTTTQRPTTTTTPSYQKPGGGGDDVTVLENYQIISNKGINEYKLRLSNGLSDYKKITKKHIGKDIIYVQSGYYSVPVDPEKNKFNIIHYIADEKGYRIVGVQPCSSVHQCKALEE
ncbi:streptococcal surface protein B [Bactrocera neohumeralis]|uniref:streptococcal surface protein B n=1 Tax=Bactrocera neohumeralis TaxID=98809 RepID=UPI002165C2B1|nr:streptococcal surface protein B [Bactrocera neohumeralis]